MVEWGGEAREQDVCLPNWQCGFSQVWLRSRDSQNTPEFQELTDPLFKLRDQGNTAIVIEHNLDVINLVDFADASLMILSDLYPALPIVTADKNDFAVYLRGRSRRTRVTR